MKHIAYILGAAFLSLLLGLAVTAIFSVWYEPRYIRSDDDMNQVGKIFLLVVWPIFVVIGGFFGHWLFRRSATRRSRERS